MYSVLVVVTMNTFGIPGLMTDKDRFYKVSCDYTNFVQNQITARGPGMIVKYDTNRRSDIEIPY